MGVTCILIPIDHARGVVAGQRAHDAAAAGDLGPLRAIVRELLALPRVVDEATITSRRARVSRLEEVSAPRAIIDNERRLLAEALGEGREPAQADRADLDELRRLFRTWSMHPHTDVDKAWDLIHWLADAARRGRAEASSRASVIDRALYGSEPTPAVVAEETFTGYNPPAQVAEISRALDAIDPTAWTADSFVGCPQDTLPYPLHEPPDDEFVDYARHHFGALRRAYALAASAGLGIAVSHG